MNILVCLKQTFDTEEQIMIEEGKILDEDVEWVINPYCEYAVEEAIRVKEVHGGEVVALTVGTDQSQQALRQAMAIGVDRGILIDIEDVEVDVDEHSIAKLLTKTIEKEAISFDLIICGYMSIDQGAAQVGIRLAELLKIPHVSTITQLMIEGAEVHVEKDNEGDIERIQTTLPLLVTAQQGLNEPRYPKLPDIMRSKRKPLTVLDIDDLDLEEEEITAKTKETDLFLPPTKKEGRVFVGDTDSQVNQLLDALHQDEKVI